MYKPFFIALTLGLLLAACRKTDDAPEAPPDGVRSHLAGRLTVDPAVDSVADYRGFEVLVGHDEGDGFDTLGFTTTDSLGDFAMTITAPDRGVYPILIRRRGHTLKVDELAVAHGDSAQITAVFPVGNRPLRVRSAENAAWMAYRNGKAQHNAALARMLGAGAYDEQAVGQRISQTAMILWSLRESFPGTVGADLAATEAVALLGGWNDSLALAHAREIEPSNPGFVQTARVARQAEARRRGQQAALALLRDFQARADDAEKQAGIQSEIVLAHLDSLALDSARAAAQRLGRQYPDTRWAEWADRARYEIDHLMPGMDAPDFTLRTQDGQRLALADLRGRVTVLEFFAPANEVFLRELPARNALAAALDDAPFTFVSVSLDPDTLRNDAFLEGRPLAGRIVYLPDALAEGSLARRYNVNAVPTRYLLDREGKIVGKYVGSTLSALQRDVLLLLDGV